MRKVAARRLANSGTTGAVARRITVSVSIGSPRYPSAARTASANRPPPSAEAVNLSIPAAAPPPGNPPPRGGVVGNWPHRRGGGGEHPAAAGPAHPERRGAGSRHDLVSLPRGHFRDRDARRVSPERREERRPVPAHQHH